jgi:25S rRNA (adenine2142-N1)-methyltransferase
MTACGINTQGAPPMPVLEVGAINTRLLSIPWLAVRAIDLRSAHPSIETADFFDLPQRAEYAAVVSSMVRCVKPSVYIRLV